MYCFSSLNEFSNLRKTIKAELVNCFGQEALHVFIAINEAVNNAIFHGNQNDNSKKVYVTIEQIATEVKIVIRDEGDGFSKQDEPDVMDQLEENGRGLAIIQHSVDSYRRNSLGNEITLIKKLKGDY